MKPYLSPLVRHLASLGLLCGTVVIQGFQPDLETRLETQGLASYAGYGTHVAVCGDRVVVGAAGAVVQGVRSGAAYVFVQENGVWTMEAELRPADPVNDSRFGYAVDLSGDTIVVGAYGDAQYGMYAGAAYVFVRDPSGWIQQAKLTASDAHSWLQFGDPVAIDGDRLVVGAFADSVSANYSGAAYVFLRQAGQWQQETKLKAGVPRANAYFGFALAIQGNAIGVGAPFSNLGANPYVGSAYVFELIDGLWTQTAELWADNPASYQMLGWSVALDTNTLVAGAPMSSVVVAGSGVAYLFHGDGTGWSQTATLAADDATSGDWFGYSVAIQNDVLAVGASQDKTFGNQSGSVYLFSRDSAGWSQTMELSASDISPGDRFGYGIGFDGSALVVGAPYKAVDGAPGAGAAYVFATEPSVPANEPPLADASATVSRVLASDAMGGWVTLDGSKSYDPDDDPLTFEWYLGEIRIAEGAVATVQLGIGSHSIALRVSDGTFTATDSVLVEVVSVNDAIAGVVVLLGQSSIPKGQETALGNMLRSALQAIDRGRPSQAIQHLRTFQNLLNVQSGKQLDPDTASSLQFQAQAIIDVLK
jgi:hypothetical protein